MLSINTNLSSIIAQRSMKQSTNKLNQAIERMTTGAKINHAKDNAANYNIATNMTTKLGALQVAEDNCAMGLDMLDICNSSLELIFDKLVRLKNLSLQACNDSFAESSLKVLEAEASSNLEEIKRIFTTTSYNGVTLFEEQKISLFQQEVSQIDTSSLQMLKDVDEILDLADGTYSISTPEELLKLANMTNDGKISSGDNFVLASDIDLEKYSFGEGWIPIGNSINSFKGNFDGNGFVIRNLSINRSNSDYQGLFGYSTGFIKNLGIENVEIIGKNNVGGLAGRTLSITNCYVVGDIVGENYVGLLAGKSGSIRYSNTHGNVTGSEYVGGLVAYLHTYSIINCYSSSDVVGTNYVGGLVGHSINTPFENCYSTGSIVASSRVGGLVGFITGFCSFYSCYSQGTVSGNSHVGGIVGLDGHNASTPIENCYVLGNSENLTGIFVGGISSAGDIPQIRDSYYLTSYSNYNKTYIDEVYWNNVSTRTSVEPYKYSNYNIDDTLPVDKIIVFNLGNSQVSFVSSISGLDFNRLKNIDLNSYAYLEVIEQSLINIANKVTEYSSMQNRLESALEEISTQYENLLSSRSTLQDADIADISSEYIRQQILQQASATLLSTANQSPSIALQLI